MGKLKIEFTALIEMAELSSEGVIIYSLVDRRIMFANLIAFNILGLNEDSRQSDIESVVNLVMPEDREYVKSQYSALRKNPFTLEIEFRLMSSGRQNTFLCCNAYLLSRDSTLIVFIRDVTKPKEHENYLAEFGARKNTVLDTLTHHMSGALNLMQHLSFEAEKYIESTTDKNLKIYLGLLKDNSKSCLEIINDLLKNEHEISPEISVKHSRIDVVKKISFIHDELQRSYRARKFLFYHPAGHVFINIDEIKLLQVVNNLTSNAIKFSPNAESIIINIDDNDQEVVVSVRDNGIGIPQQLRPSIFERQLGTGRTGLNGERSIGLGLYICKSLIQLMNGKIWFESKEGEGSIFYISLPKH